MRYDLRDKVAALTGGSGGIGRAVAVALAREGARLGIAARGETQLMETAALVEAAGGAARSFPCDVTDDDSVRAMVEDVAGRLGRLDVFMNIAGVTLEKSIEDAEPDDYRRIMETNLLGTVRCAMAALPHLKKSRGVLVNVASLIVKTPFPRLGVYACSKGAVSAFSRTLRQELHGSGVRVLTVYPTVVKTAMVDEEPVLARTPSQTPEQCARAIIKAIKKGKIETDTALLPKIQSALYCTFPRVADRLNRLFLPPGY
ncbi:MAG: SDR family oxidoreductase [Desulfobacterales bacterium]|nr:SDR family oxidoreductase [Desulfobacterales bacterium]